jgi:hypothetical protein
MLRPRREATDFNNYRVGRLNCQKNESARTRRAGIAPGRANGAGAVIQDLNSRFRGNDSGSYSEFFIEFEDRTIGCFRMAVLLAKRP